MGMQTTFIGTDGKKHFFLTQAYPEVGAIYCILDNKPDCQMSIREPEVSFHLKIRKAHEWIKEESSEIPEKPKSVKSCWHNEGRTMDEYTIVLNTHENSGNKKFFDCLGLSKIPDSPNGYSQFSLCSVGNHLGKRIKFETLPINIIRHIVSRLKTKQK